MAVKKEIKFHSIDEINHIKFMINNKTRLKSIDFEINVITDQDEIPLVQHLPKDHVIKIIKMELL